MRGFHYVLIQFMGYAIQQKLPYGDDAVNRIFEANIKQNIKSPHYRPTVSEIHKRPGPRFNTKMSSFQYRKTHCGDKTILRPFYIHNGISYTGKMASLYWIGIFQ